MTLAPFRSVNIDQFNAAFILISCAVAYILPFELVLFSYAFLGPAHYLTQISWMHDRSYFTGHRWLLPVFLILTLLLILTRRLLDPAPADLGVYLLFSAAFSISFALVSFRKPAYRVFAGSVLFSFLMVLQYFYSPFMTLVIFLLPTVIHIYIFTGAFMLLGALKTGSRWGMISFWLLLACGAGFFLLPPFPYNFFESYIANNLNFFFKLSDYLGNLLSFGTQIPREAPLGFLSFAYTYHYLNWFSKAEIINWHKIPTGRFIGLCGAYILSVSLYLYDYYTGLMALLFLSLLHVLLEFPLNVLTFRQIGQKLFLHKQE